MELRPPPAERVPLLVLGLGNVLCGDDGLGIEAVRRLAEARRFGPEVVVADGGVLGLALLPTMESARNVLVVDAVRADRPPGSLVALDGDEVIPALRERLSAHEVGLWDLLWAARLRGALPERIAIAGLVPASLEVGAGLSREVAAALPALVRAVARTAAAWGFRSRAAPSRATSAAPPGPRRGWRSAAR